MATQVLNSSLPKAVRDAGRRHALLLRLVTLAMLGVIIAVAVYGFPYYCLPLVRRPSSPLHVQLRPSGSIGLMLGKLGFVLFLLIYLYAIRKRWPWLKKFGNSRHWFDFHVVLGIAAPMVITLHSSFKLHGLAGMAFWIMWAVTLSGFVGRYFYGQIPRSLNAAELSLNEMENLHASLARKLSEQTLFTDQDLTPLFRLPTREQVRAMSIGGAVARMILLDIARPFRVSKLRRKAMGSVMLVASLGDFSHLGTGTWRR